ncbi:MAG: SPASM domain-containing protein, partial [Caldilinea sp.]|nr:SPASM domain-containing protein [Caldilinea sp.]
NLQQAAAAGVRIHSSTVITRQNYHQVDEIAALSRSLGARRAVFNRYLGAAAPALEPDAAQLRHAVQGIEQLIQRHAGYGRDEFDVRYGNCIPQCFTPSSSSGCWAGIAYCTIDPWGNLRPCNHSPTIVGNLFESSITELWHSETMTRWRGLTPAGCADCTAFDLCRGGCRALVELRQQDPLIGEPLSEHEAPRIIQLPQHRRPLLACTVRPESFGYSLVRGHALVQATHAAESLLDRLDGTMSLQEVSDEYGEDGLEFVGVLYLNGMLSLAN